MFERKIYKRQAREQLKNRWTHPILIKLILVGASMGVSMIFIIIALLSTVFFQLPTLSQGSQNIDPNDVVDMLKSIIPGYIFGMLLYIAVYGVVTLALHYFYLSFSKDNNTSTVNTFFKGFSFWIKGILGYFWWFLWIFLWVLPLVIPTWGMLAVILIENNSTNSPLFWIYFTCCIFVWVPITIKGIAYSQMFFIIAENPTISVQKAMKMSIAMTRGFKWKFFVMLLSFLGWFYLSMLTLYILLLWLLPYMFTSFAYAYQSMKKDVIDRKILIHADFEQKENIPAIAKPATAIDKTDI